MMPGVETTDCVDDEATQEAKLPNHQASNGPSSSPVNGNVASNNHVGKQHINKIMKNVSSS